jgi:catechol 2,3-dioxygenase
MGHVHLRVADVEGTEAFYHRALGLDVMARIPSALFLSAGGYHHHLGANTWESAGGSAPPPGSRGLRSFDVVLPSGEEAESAVQRLEAAGFPAERDEAGILVADPSGNRVLLRAA